MTVEKQFGDRLKELRKSKRVNQKMFSNVIGVSMATVSKWENGYRIPEVATLKAIAAYFDTPVFYLLGGPLEETDERVKKLLRLSEKSRRVIDVAIDAAYQNDIEDGSLL